MKNSIQFNKGLGIVAIVILLAVLIGGGVYVVQKGSGTTLTVPTITLLSPNGGETLTIGQPTTVTFKTEGEIKDGYQVVIWLDEGAAPLATIAATTTSYSLTIPESILIGGDAVAPLEPGSYKIRVTLHDGVPCTGHCLPSDVKELATDSSDGEVVISKGGTQVESSSNSSKNIVVTSPAKGDVWSVGEEREIRWSNYSGTEALTVAVREVVSGKVVTSNTVATVPAASTGVYKWKVPNIVKEFTNYQIEVYPAGGRELVGRSETFSISIGPASYTNPSITILSPKEGEIFKVGEKLSIKWKDQAAKDLDSFNIFLINQTLATPVVITVASNVSIRASGINGTYLYELVIPQVTYNDKYKIEVYRSTARELTGRSGEFTITN